MKLSECETKTNCHLDPGFVYQNNPNATNTNYYERIMNYAPLYVTFTMAIQISLVFSILIPYERIGFK